MNAEQTEYQNVAVSALKESALNPRRSFDKKAIEELEKSIRETGKVLTPLLVAPSLREAIEVEPKNGHRSFEPGGTYEILAGARRWRCAKKIGLETVPARVLEGLSAAQKLEIMVIENLQRADVHPLEEAQGFQALLAMTPADGGPSYIGKAETDQKLKVLDIAKKVGMSEKYVYDRLKLLELAPAATKLFQDGKIEAGHAILLARLEPAEQADVLKHADWEIKRGALSVRDLADQISYRNQQKKYKAEAAASRKKDTAERKKGGKKEMTWQERQAEENRKREAQRVVMELEQKAELVARVATVEKILEKVDSILPVSVLAYIAGDIKGKLKPRDIPRAVIRKLCGRYHDLYCWSNDVRAVNILANIYGIKPVKPEPVKAEPAKEIAGTAARATESKAETKAQKKKPRSKKKRLQTSAKSAAKGKR